MIQASPAPTIAAAICHRTAAAQSALDNMVGLMAILYAGIDALPGENPLADGIVRARRVLGGPLHPGQPHEFAIDLWSVANVFKAGHRVMVQVQSTWFPIIDRNPQTFTKSIFDADEKDFVRATHRVYRSARYPSRVEVPVVVAGESYALIRNGRQVAISRSGAIELTPP